MLRKLLRDTRFFLILPIVAALIYPDFGKILREWLIPILFVMMLIPFLRLKTPKFAKTNFKFASKMFFLNYILYVVVALMISSIIKEDLLRYGVMVLAFMPPAVAIMKWVYFTEGDLEKAFFSETTLYMASLFITPFLMWYFFREMINLFTVIKTLFLLIIVPFLVSRPLQGKIKWDLREVMNIVTGLGTYIVISLNIEKVLSDPYSFVPLIIVFTVLIFGLGFLTYFYTRIKGIPKKQASVYVLFSNSKNANLALGFALLLFDPLVSLPFVISAVIRTLYNFVFIWLFQ